MIFTFCAYSSPLQPVHILEYFQCKELNWRTQFLNHETSQVQDVTFLFVRNHEISVDSFLQPVKVSLKGSTTIYCVNHSNSHHPQTYCVRTLHLYPGHKWRCWRVLALLFQSWSTQIMSTLQYNFLLLSFDPSSSASLQSTSLSSKLHQFVYVDILGDIIGVTFKSKNTQYQLLFFPNLLENRNVLAVCQPFRILPKCNDFSKIFLEQPCNDIG